jgi:hypothetical protein
MTKLTLSEHHLIAGQSPNLLIILQFDFNVTLEAKFVEKMLLLSNRQLCIELEKIFIILEIQLFVLQNG